MRLANNQLKDEIRESVEECSTMYDTLTVSGEAAPTGVTEFVQEACVATEVLGSFYKGSRMVVPQRDIQDITEYFSRPRLVARGSLPFVRSIVTRGDVNFNTITAAFPQWANRLSGVYGIRFSLNMRLQIAATAFHQGVLSLGWQYNTNFSDVGVFPRYNNVAACTNLPHVRLDMSETTMVELKIPFMFQTEFLPVSTTPAYPNYSYGAWSIASILNTLSVVGMAAPTYELYWFLTDVELFGADNNATTNITLQGGKMAATNEQKDAHVFSDVLSGTSKAVSFVGRNIPMLSSIASTTSWALDTAAGLAKYFGYSRPILTDPVVRMTRSTYVGEGNVDVPASGFVLGPMQSNTLATDSNFSGTDIDEMSLSYVLQQWSQICVGNISTGDIHTTVVYATNVSPSSFWFRNPPSNPYCNIPPPTASTAGNNSFLPSHLFYWSQFFRSWRGRIIFRFTFAKTKFHGGRYMISYNPSETNQLIPTTLTGFGPEVLSSLVQPYGHSQIADLKDGNVFEFVVPYEPTQPFMAWGANTGTLSLTCIDPLQSASSVTQVVPFLVEVKADADFELANFKGGSYYPIPSGTIRQQSGKVVSITKEPNQYTMGERITSAKQLIAMPHYTSATITGLTRTVQFGFPWWYYRPIDGTVPLPTASSELFAGSGRTGGSIATCYVWARGSTDFHVYPLLTDNFSIFAQYHPSDGVSQNAVNQTTYPASGYSSNPKVIATNGQPLHVRVPSFQTTLRIPTWALAGWQWIFDLGVPARFTLPVGPFSNTLLGFPRFLVNNGTSTATTVYASTAAGDDAGLAHYMGPCPLAMPQSTNTSAIERDWFAV
jgi:hypothetical protein